MKVLGVDFTSSPSRRKPITCLNCTFRKSVLRAGKVEEWTEFSEFEKALRRRGPWIAGMDFPFGQSRRFVENIGWPGNWRDYVMYARSLGKKEFRYALDSYRQYRARGDKEHRRQTDVAAGAISPQKLYGVPVGLMFFEGAPRLVEAGVTIPHLHQGDPKRIAVEAYPGILARQVIYRRKYKDDTKSKQTAEQHKARLDILAGLRGEYLGARYGIEIIAPDSLCEDPTGDQVDALLCAIQAAWTWQNRKNNFGAPLSVDPLEGWIAYPTVL